MRTQHLLAGGLALLTTVATMAAIPSGSRTAATPAASGAHLQAFGVRGPAEQPGSPRSKLDSTLADLTRHLATTGNSLSGLHSLHPAARFALRSPLKTPYILVDAVTRGDPQVLKAKLVALGLTRPAVFANDVGGWLPVSQLDAAAGLAELHSMRTSMSRTRTGAVTTQGDYAQHSNNIRTTYPGLTGAGVTVGVLSDSFNCYPVYAMNGLPAAGTNGYAPNGFLNTAASDSAGGDLPASVNVVEEADCMNYGAPIFLPFADEGRAISQIVHDIAPGAGLAFYTAENSEADFANGILALQQAGAKVIADDVGYFDEPFFQDGMVSQAIDQVNAKGVSYFSAAGNNGSNAYYNTAPGFTTVSNSAPNSGEHLLNFDASGATTTTSLPITIPALFPGEFLALVLEWDQPYVTGAVGSPGASSHMDLCVSGSGGDFITDLDGHSVACTGANATGSDALQVLLISNPANATANTASEQLTVMVGVADGTTPPGRVLLVLEDNGAGATIDSFATHSATLQGHPGAQGAAAIGAAYYGSTPACGTSPAVAESYSALGGAPILFDTTGHALATPVVRQKPDVIGTDGVNTTFFGEVLAANDPLLQGLTGQCVDNKTGNQNYPSFFGTSAATPHAAGAAALFLQANATLTPAQIYAALQKSAAPMSSSPPDFATGYGLIQADAALKLLPPAAPALTVSPASVTTGAQATLTWSSLNTTACTATGGWTGAQMSSGTKAITAPSTAGTTTYTLTCSNGAGSSTATSVALTTTASSTSGGGGTSGSGGGTSGSGSGSGTSGSGGSSGTGGTTPTSSGGGGGGAISEFTLLALSALVALQMLRRRRVTAAREI